MSFDDTIEDIEKIPNLPISFKAFNPLLFEHVGLFLTKLFYYVTLISMFLFSIISVVYVLIAGLRDLSNTRRLINLAVFKLLYIPTLLFGLVVGVIALRILVELIFSIFDISRSLKKQK
eukprot:gene53-4303_t